jgi:transcriptional regulator with XRE-family HTH domain
MSSIGERLIELRKQKGVTQRAAAQALGITPAALNLYEHNTRMPKKESAVRLCEYYHCDMNYLYGASDEQVSPKMGGIVVSIFQMQDLTDGTINPKKAVSSFSVPNGFLSGDRFYYAVEAPDDSMQGASIRQGDYAIFTLSDKLRPQEIMLVALNGRPMIRRCVTDGTTVSRLMPTSEGFASLDLKPSDNIILLGKLVAVLSSK